MVCIISLSVGGANWLVNTLLRSLLAKCFLIILTISSTINPRWNRDSGIGLAWIMSCAIARSNSCCASVAKISGL